MKGKRTGRVKKSVDVCMSLLLLCLMAYPVTGDTLHEWCGIAMTALLIVHHVLNRKWYASLFKGRCNAYRSVTVFVNTLLLASVALTALCGMAMSARAVPFLYGFLPVSFARQTHLAFSHWSFLLMGVHLGLHLPAMAQALQLSRRVKAAAVAVFAAAAICGCVVFFKNGIARYLFFRTPFAFFDGSKGVPVVFAENLAMLLCWAFLGAVCARVLQRRTRKRREAAS